MTAALLEDAIELLVGGIVQMASGIGTGANAFVTSLLVGGTESVPALTSFAGTVFAFGGVALAIGFTTKIFMWITSIGARG